MAIIYDQKHWEALLGTIIERIGVEQFVEHAAYALEQHGYFRLAKYVGDCQFLASSEERLRAFDEAMKMPGDVGAND